MPYPDDLNLTNRVRVKDWSKIKEADNTTFVTGGETLGTILDKLINRASAFILKEAGRLIFYAKPVTQKYNGNGKQVLIPNDLPINSVSNVVVNGIVIPQTVDYKTYGWYNDDEVIYLYGYCFERGPNNVEITMNIGVQANSNDAEIAEQACLELCNFKWERRSHPDQTMEKTGTGFISTSFSLDAIPKEVRQAINSLSHKVPRI